MAFIPKPMMDVKHFNDDELEDGVLMATGFDENIEGIVHVDLQMPIMYKGTLRFSLHQFKSFCFACDRVLELSREIDLLMQGVHIALADNPDVEAHARAFMRLNEAINAMQQAQGASPERVAKVLKRNSKLS